MRAVRQAVKRRMMASVAFRNPFARIATMPPPPPPPPPPDPAKVFFTPSELAERWSVSVGTLKNWRFQGRGPDFIRLSSKGGPVIYRLSTIEAYELQQTVDASA